MSKTRKRLYKRDFDTSEFDARSWRDDFEKPRLKRMQSALKSHDVHALLELEEEEDHDSYV